MIILLTIVSIIIGWCLLALVTGVLVIIAIWTTDAKDKKKKCNDNSPITLMDVLKEIDEEQLFGLSLFCFFLWWIIIVPVIIVLICQVYNLHNRIIIYDENWFKKKESK